MEAKQPTQQQWEEVLMWCGFKYVKDERGWGSDSILYPDGDIRRVSVGVTGYPPINLNNLFKYAAPKLVRCELWRNLTYDNGITGGNWTALVTTGDQTKSHPLATSENDVPALALFWAIWEVIKDGH